MKTLGQLAYETHSIGLYTNQWEDLSKDRKDHWEDVANRVASHITDQILESLQKKVAKRVEGRKPQEDDFDDNPYNLKVLYYYDVQLAAHIACEDRRPGIVNGKCIQCRNPHYDGMCECRP